MEYQHVLHTFGPVVDSECEILILGSMPSAKSREINFYYGHPQNRFWKVISQIYDEKLPLTIDEKKEMLLKNHIALWDVIASCDIIGSSDQSIKNVVGNDMSIILKQANIRKIYANGNKAYELFEKYCVTKDQPEVIKLPSTSPANAMWTLERLTAEWKQIILGN